VARVALRRVTHAFCAGLSVAGFFEVLEVILAVIALSPCAVVGRCLGEVDIDNRITAFLSTRFLKNPPKSKTYEKAPDRWRWEEKGLLTQD
jgi:hypothetical protein